MLLENNAFSFLAEPLPGEILSSVFIRSALMCGETPYRFYRSATGKTLTGSFFDSCLDCFSDFESALERTVYPYFFSVLTGERWEKIIAAIRNGESVGQMLPNYMHEGLRKKQPHYCVECLREDLAEFGTGYFHLVHQYDGVTCCLRHGLRLTPCLRPLSAAIPGPEDIVKASPAGAQEIEEAEILLRLPGMKLEELREIYSACIDIMDDLPGPSKNRVIENAAGLNLSFPVVLGRERFRYLLGETDSGSCHPYFHVAMIKALAQEIGSVEAVLQKPFKPCRNPRCRSDNTKRMGENIYHHNYWKCLDCGQVFSDMRITQLGAKGKKLLVEHEEKSDGGVSENIAGLGISENAYQKLMADDPECVDKEVSYYRKIAEKYDSQNELREEVPKAYYFLHRYDRRWISRFFSGSFDPMRTPVDEQAKAERDERALEKARAAFEKAQSGDAWINASFLQSAAGLNKSKKTLQNCYPRTLEFIKTHAETCEASWVRRIRHFVDNYDFKEELTPGVLRKEFGRSKYVSIAYRRLENYIREKERQAYAL